MAKRAHRRVCGRRGLGSTSPGRRAGRREEQQRVDLLGFELLPSGSRRCDHAEPYLCVSNGCAARWSAASRPGGAGAVTATLYVFSRSSSLRERGRAADEREHDERRGEERLAAQALADLAPGDERDRAAARSSRHQLEEELGERRRPVAERDDLRRPLRSGEHLLRVDVAADEQPQVAVAALDELDAGDVRQPLRRRAVEL